MEFGRDGCENVFRNPICNASLAFADGQEARLVTSEDGRFVFSLLTTVSLNGGWVPRMSRGFHWKPASP